MVGHTLKYTVSKNEVNRTDSSRDIDVLVSYLSPKIFSYSEHYQLIHLRHGFRSNTTTTHFPVCPGHCRCYCQCADSKDSIHKPACLWLELPRRIPFLLHISTTFNSPFGRYHFLRLPFGLVCSQDIFQKKMDQILEECQGCIGIADDITVHGRTEAEHDACLRDLMRVACKYDLVFNPQKTHVKAQAINFFGCLYDANGVHPDPDKVDAVHALPAPTNVTELQEFLGLVTYLSPFIPGLSTLTAPLLPCFWVGQGSCRQWHHPQVLRSITSSDHPSWCLTGRPWCSTPAEWQTHSLCQQGPHQNWMPICKHWERNASCCLRSREITHLCLWTVIHDRIRPQAAWIHLQKEPGRHTCMATMHDVTPTGIRFHHPLPPR